MLSAPRRSNLFPVLIVLAIVLLSTACSAPASEITLRTTQPVYSGNIYIGGAVNNPGVYPFSADDSLEDLIAAAGGLATGTSLSDVSLTIPDPASSAAQRIDINTAEAWLLTALPGIGATHASDIIAYREANGPFRSITDLLKVKGIGQATLDKIKDYITVGG
jgi:competence protein ComEA